MTSEWVGTDLSVSAIVPVFNDRDLLISTVGAVGSQLVRCVRDYEIIVVESGSTDGSVTAADALAEADRHVRVIHEGRRNGFGSALRLGYARSTMDLIWLVPPDVGFPLETVAAALPLARGHRCVLSYRSSDPRPLPRRIQSWVYNHIVRWTLGLRARSVNSAFKLLDRRIVQRLDLRTNGWFIDAELIYHLERLRVPYVEIPVPLIDRVAGRSTVTASTWSSVLRDLYVFARTHPRLGR